MSDPGQPDVEANVGVLRGELGGQPVAAARHTFGDDDQRVRPVMTALAAAFIRNDRIITRREGAIALALYVLFVAITVLRG